MNILVLIIVLPFPTQRAPRLHTAASELGRCALRRLVMDQLASADRLCYAIDAQKLLRCWWVDGEDAEATRARRKRQRVAVRFFTDPTPKARPAQEPERKRTCPLLPGLSHLSRIRK